MPIHESDTLLNNDPIFIILSRERKDGPDAKWGLDFQIPFEYLEGNLALEFAQVFGFHFIDIGDARLVLDKLNADYGDTLTFKIVDVDIYEVAGREI